MPSPTEISVQQLSRLIGTPNAPLLVDLCIDEDFELDPRILPTAMRWNFKDMAGLAAQLKANNNAQNVVVYCQKGKKISMGAAATLRAHGVGAEYLTGGHFGWRDAGEPLVPFNNLPAFNVEGRTVWVTRHRPKIDRIACPWLIRRFVDSRAQFLFVAPQEVEAVAEKFEATPFDIEGVYWSHRGDQCTFDMMIDEFKLQSAPLLKLATIVRGADTDKHELAPEAAGLLAASLGLSRMYRDDLEQLEAGMLLYDSFYRWARDASDEGHNWPAALTTK